MGEHRARGFTAAHVDHCTDPPPDAAVATAIRYERIVSRLEREIAHLRSLVAVCEPCGGEGVLPGLVVGDATVDERCPACGGHGAVLTNRLEGATA